MKTKYIGIESISVIENLRATIACNIMFEEHNYDGPIYTNIFCSYSELLNFLDLDGTDFSEQIKSDIINMRILSNEETMQIDLPDYLDDEIEWNFRTMINLIPQTEEEIPFTCYTLDL